MNEYIRFTPNGFAKTGEKLDKHELIEILSACYQISKDKKKGSYGAIFAYDSDTLGEHDEDCLSTGVIFCDIDYITKEQAEAIFNNFDKLCEKFSPLLAIQYSHSYYVEDKPKNGLHIFVKSYPLLKTNYETNAKICLAIIAELINKVLGIDLLEYQKKTNQKVLDYHNTNLYQRFHPFYSEYKYNENAEEYDDRLISLDTLVYIQKKHHIKFEEETPKNTVYFGGYSINGYKWYVKDSKLKIDRNFRIGEYTGNDIRWRISLVAEKLFGDKAKDFCDCNFYFENDKSIFSHINNFDKMSLNPLILKWLEENKYIYKQEELQIREWIQEYHTIIKKKIESTKARGVMIKAPTCSGKTYYVNNILAKELNAIVVSPFNTNLHLYDKCFYVDSHYTGAIPKSKPVSIIWDQFIKRQNEFQDRYIIVDESHTLYFDREYRESAIKMIEYLLKRNSKVICISATPAGEEELLGLEEISFNKKKDPIDVVIFKNLSNHELYIFNYIKKCLDNCFYDYIVFFSDRLAKKVYENFVTKGYGDKISYLRSSTKDCEDFVKIREKEMIDKPLTITTCIAYNGLNFKNKDKRVLMIGEIEQNKTTSGEIIQQLGRFRFSKVKGIYTYVEKLEEDIDEKERKAEEMMNLYSKGVDDIFLQYDRRYLNKKWVDIKREITEYTIKKSDIDVISKELGYTGYIQGKVIDKEGEDEYHLNLEIKRLESDIMKDDIKNDKFIDKDYHGDYSWKWAEDIRHIISNPIYQGITIDDFKEIIKASTKNKLIDGIIDEIKDTIKIIALPDDEYESFIKNMNMYKNMLTNDLYKRDFMNRIKYIKEVRNKYKDKITLQEKETVVHEILTDIISSEYENASLNLVSGGVKGGKISSPKKKVVITDLFKNKEKYNLSVGQEFESCSALSDYVHKSTKSVSKWINKGWIEKVP